MWTNSNGLGTRLGEKQSTYYRNPGDIVPVNEL
jgi:hypothetical protein